MQFLQNYNPLDNALLSTLVAAIPIVVLLGSIALLQLKIHYSALLGLVVAFVIALFVYEMPFSAATATTIYGAGYGLFPIGWIILNLIFLYQLTVQKGWFTILRSSLAQVAPDPRVQVILIAFSFGAFFEGAAGFGTPVAVTAAILIQLGFRPLAACGLSLIANTAPVAYGALGTPIVTLAAVTDLDVYKLSAMAGRQLPFFSVIVPFWVVWAFAGFRGMLGVWPAALTAGVAFAIPQFLVSNYHGPWLVDITASMCSMGALVILLQFWRPKKIWKLSEPGTNGADPGSTASPLPASTASTPPLVSYSRSEILRAWVPWILLSGLVFIWGIPQFKKLVDGKMNPAAQADYGKKFTAPSFKVSYLHNVVVRTPPVVPPPTPEKSTAPESAVFNLNWVSATGTGILVSALFAGVFMGFSLRQMARTYLETLVRVRYSLITIAAMLALGYVTKYSGTDATLGLALAKTGVLYPFFGTLLGWLGVALTGSDTASNVLFGSLQRITAEQTGLSPILMGAANSSGGVMGKMVDAQSIVVASTATNWYGHEGAILRYVFFHSIALAILVGLLVYLQAYVYPFSKMVIH